MKVMIPMSGEGVRFREAGYRKIKPLIVVRGKPIIEHLLSAFPAEWPKIFVCNEEQFHDRELRSTLDRLAPGAEVVAIPKHKKGPVWAVLEAVRVSPGCLSEDEPVIINYCDFAFAWKPQDFLRMTEQTRCDGAVFCYTGFHPEYIRPTLYAYCREEKGRILEVKEKGHFTADRNGEYASSGSYYFKSGALVRKYFARAMEEGPLFKGEGYISIVYNPMIKDGLNVRVFEIPYFLQFGTPQDLKDFEYWDEVFQRYPFSKDFWERRSAPRVELNYSARIEENSERVGSGNEGGLQDDDPRGEGRTQGNQVAQDPPFQLLMPMAGRGARFAGEIPKPLLPVLNRPMFRAAVDFLPKAVRHVFVVRKEFGEQVRKVAPARSKLVEIEGVTEGQAITCELGAKALDPKLPVFVSSCDHGLLWDESQWQKLLEAEPDVIVWGQRNYPGADVTPKAFAYINAKANGADIESVSVKEPLSDNPRGDLLLVGTFYFKSSELMTSLIQELKEKNIRVNNEFYLDSVVNLAVQRKLNVKAFESQGYLCWGTPTSLQEFNYWHSYFKNNTVGDPEPGKISLGKPPERSA